MATQKTTNNKQNDFEFYLDLYMREAIEFEGDLWQLLNPIVVKLNTLEQRRKDGISDDTEYGQKLIIRIEEMKKEFLQKYN